jgi:hypothetical protein
LGARAHTPDCSEQNSLEEIRWYRDGKPSPRAGRVGVSARVIAPDARAQNVAIRSPIDGGGQTIPTSMPDGGAGNSSILLRAAIVHPPWREQLTTGVVDVAYEGRIEVARILESRTHVYVTKDVTDARYATIINKDNPIDGVIGLIPREEGVVKSPTGVAILEAVASEPVDAICELVGQLTAVPRVRIDLGGGIIVHTIMTYAAVYLDGGPDPLARITLRGNKIVPVRINPQWFKARATPLMGPE